LTAALLTSRNGERKEKRKVRTRPSVRRCQSKKKEPSGFGVPGEDENAFHPINGQRREKEKKNKCCFLEEKKK